MAVDADLVILGGGCAGLSLARRLAIARSTRRVVVVEPRTEYTDDRSWCFWRPATHDLSHVVSTTWDRWRFSAADGRSESHSVPGFSYQYVRGADFYADARRLIDRAPGIDLRLGVRASTVESVPDGVRVGTDDGSIVARHVVDTRPRRTPALLHQCFAGVEIEVSGSAFPDPGEAGLMTEMDADESGLGFMYVLPLAGGRALVEWTRFSDTPLPRADVVAELSARVARLGFASNRVVRTEGGTLAMGPFATGEPAIPGVVAAGIAGGALRAASGYGFLRMQRWAADCTAAVLHGAPIPHPAEPFARREMDRIFLQAIRAHPERTADYFMALASGVAPHRLLRFLTDQARPMDYARIIASLPLTPFLEQIPRRSIRTAALDRVSS